MSRAEPIVVAGSLAQRPRTGGHAWVFLQYLLGFRRLGREVLFLDWLEPAMCGGPVAGSANAAYLASVMERFGLGGAYSLLDRSDGSSAAGLSREEVLQRVRSSALLLNVMGYLDDDDILSAATRRVFLDIDPGFPQMWSELGLADPFRGHDDFVTIAENLGQPGCGIPTCGFSWITTRPPVVIERWPRSTEEADRFTSVATWRGPFGPVTYGGATFGLRVHEFRKFASLPRRSGHAFELALDIDPAEKPDLELLRENGWRLADPLEAAGDPDRYQAYVARSLGELMVAKNMYVETSSGWFSDRSACYLASGRPVLAQDTGLRQLYPTGEGLVAFSTLEEALTGVETICDDYERQAAAARAIAEEHFDSDRVLERLLEALSV